MYICIGENGELSLQDCDNMRAFSIVMDSADVPLTRLQEIAELAEDDHYWLRVEAVEELSPRQGDQQWIRDFRAMLASVADYGYYDLETNRVKAHVEHAHEKD